LSDLNHSHTTQDSTWIAALITAGTPTFYQASQLIVVNRRDGNSAASGDFAYAQICSVGAGNRLFHVTPLDLKDT